MPHNSLINKKGLLTLKIFIIATIFCCCSGKSEIEYRPGSKTLTNKQLGQNVTLVILDFPDKRPPFSRTFSKRKRNLVGIFFIHYLGLRIPLRKLYTDQTTSLNVIDALENLFRANGFNVIRDRGKSGSSSLSDARLAVDGQINEFLIECAPSWRGVSPSIIATIDIDVRILDTKHQRTIWKGKIENYRRMGPNRGIFTGTSKIFLFLNTVFSDAIDEAWVDYGMLNTLKSLDKKAFSK